MQMKNQKAFTMLELTFVIVVIGILSAIAIPRFADTADSAYTVKAQTTLTTVRSALATERQRRILRGDFSAITDLSLDAAGAATTNIFDHFSGDGQAPTVYTSIFDYPVRACTGAQRACWVKVGALGYTYRFPDANTGADGQADFTLTNNRLDCTAADAADCVIITR